MARRGRSGGAEDLLVVVSRAPWWVGVLLAGASLIVLQMVANIEVRPATRAGDMAGLLLPQIAKAFASALRWVLPPLFLAAAGVSYFRRSRQAQVRPVAAVPVHEAVPTEAAAKPSRDWDIEIRRAYDHRAEEKQPPAARPTEWSRDVLERMDWKRFEMVTAAYYEHLGFRAETLACGADGGVDVKLYRGEEAQPAAIVQCKAWTGRAVGVKPVRELLGVMVHNKVETGVFLTTGTFTNEATEFAASHRIALGTGDQLLAKIAALSDVARKRLLEIAVEGDWTTPTCPSCGTKMVRRQGSAGEFWGCLSFPRCRQTFQLKAD